MTAAILCGALVGFMLALVGGGGSILATPLLLYGVGIGQPHLAIGTGALAVSFNAFVNFAAYARRGHVWWQHGASFAAFGVVGAVAGSALGKTMDGQHLIVYFGVLMLFVAASMCRKRKSIRTEHYAIDAAMLLKVALAALTTGFVSGFFGIGGGFLIVPAMMFVTGMPMLNAIATSLFVVGVLALTTTASYAVSGFVDFGLALQFIAGGLAGGLFAVLIVPRLAEQKAFLERFFAAIVCIVAIYLIVKGSSE